MYIEQAYKSLSDGWRYIVGFLILFIFGWQILGVIPLLLISFLKTGNISDFVEASGDGFVKLYEGQSNLYLILIMLTFVGGLIGLYFVIRFLHKQSLKYLITSRSRIDWKRVFFAFGVWSVFTIGSTLLAYWLSPENYEWNFKLMPFLGLFAITFLLIPLQTSFEELLFRGYLMQGIGIAARNRWLPLFLTSTVFGLMHILNPEIGKLGYEILIVYVALGFFLGIITLMDGGMELALGFHAANNMIIALLVTADWTALRTNSIFLDVSEPSISGQILPIFIILPLLLIVFGKKYKWSGWKEKLFGKINVPIIETSEITEEH